MCSADLPVIDLKEALDDSRRMLVSKKLVKTLETDGFLFLDNAETGVDQDKLFKNTKWFFDISETEKFRLLKKQWNPQNNNTYRGYFPHQLNDPSYKEGFEIGADDLEFTDPDIHAIFKEPNVWPQGTDDANEFKQDMREYFSSMVKIGSEVLRLVAMGSGLPEMWFENMFLPDTLSTLRLLHYPVRVHDPLDVALDSGTILSCSEHTDSGFLTLLSTFGFTGLQIKNEDGQWQDVAPRPGALVVNIGDALSKMFGGRFKATRHRVVDIKVDRYSVPFFFEPRYGADVNRRVTDSTKSTPESYQEYGPFLIEKMHHFSEYRNAIYTHNSGQ